MAKESEYKIFDFDEDNLKLGIAQIDEQHKHLVDMTNDLHAILCKKLEKGWQKEILLVLVEMVKYSKNHFAYEEKIMKTIHYNRFDAHKQRHDAFVNLASEKLENFEDLTVNDARGLLVFLRDWLKSHIAYEDRLYVKPIKTFFGKK